MYVCMSYVTSALYLRSKRIGKICIKTFCNRGSGWDNASTSTVIWPFQEKLVGLQLRQHCPVTSGFMRSFGEFVEATVTWNYISQFSL
uniref:Uncharacterized protein n=1 Tax=Anguilla anguilla TaxID=7936 RepID=A0A0E9WN91_ANGAN